MGLDRHRSRSRWKWDRGSRTKTQWVATTPIGISRRRSLMCGICGIWGVDKEESVERMISVMDHRGPDDRGIYRGPNGSLGMTRLAILDLSSSGHQPMANFEQTVWIVYNGEVYNFQTERQL